MGRIIVLRHAKTEPDSDTGRDMDRRLTSAGEADASETGAWLLDEHHVPDKIITSPAMRARQTATIVASAIGRPDVLVTDERLYASHVSDLLEILREHEAVRTLMIVGHNPSFGELVAGLCPEATPPRGRRLMPPGTAAIIETDAAGATFGQCHLVDIRAPGTIA